MRFELEGKIVFRKPIEEIKVEISEILHKNEDLLVKGARDKEDAAKITGFKIEGDSVTLMLESGRKVRAHDVLLRFARVMSEELGKKHKIGLKTIEIPNCRIRIPCIDPETATDRLSNLPCKIEKGTKEIVLILNNLGEADIRKRMIDRLVADAEKALVEIPRVEEEKIVKRSEPKEHKFKEDPFKLALELGWVKEFPGRGQWIYASPYAKLFTAIEDLIVEKIIKPMGFEEVLLPKLIPLKVMMKMPGYLDNVPEGMYYVCPPPRDPEAFEKFKQKIRLKKEIDVIELGKVLKNPAYVLAPAQCEPFYQQFSGKIVKMEELPVKQFDRSGWTYRWEGGGVEGLTRVQEFQRIEAIMLGKPEDIRKIRDEMVERSVALAEELGMEWRVKVATPFYLREGSEGEVGAATYDLEVFLPYNQEWLEVGSYNVHGNKFAKSFRIKEARGREVWTGCCGFGTNRWVVGFLAQHGMEMEKWPKIVRDRVIG
ncbi:MAG: aminoacyl--tRNA ligase-related protein [Candidatus Hadarchaeales archaeon]